MGYVSEGFSEEGSAWHQLYSRKKVLWSSLHPDPRGYSRLYVFVPDPGESPLISSLRPVLRDRLVALSARPSPGARIHVSQYFFSQLPPGPHSSARTNSVRPLDIACRRPAFSIPLVAQREAGLRPVIFHPGSGSPRKNWPPSRFARLIEMIVERFADVRVWILEGPQDDLAAPDVLKGLGRDSSAQRLRCSSLVHLACCLREASAVVGNDSGVTHLSGVLGAPTVAIFGASDPIQWSPLGPAVQILYRDQTCPPCHGARQRACLHPVCCRFPFVTEVLEAVQEQLD
jgi:hypothetical protein